MRNYRKQREEYRKMGKGYYHLVTDGWKDGCIFNNIAQFADLLHGKRVSEFGSKELEALTCCRIELPKHWEIHPVLGLLPKSFVNTRLVRQLFAGPKDYMTKFVKDYESFVAIARKCGEENEYGSSELKDIVSQVLLMDFEGKSLSKLNKDEMARLAVKLSKQFNIKAKSIAESLGVSIHLINQFLRSKDYGRGSRLPEKGRF